MLADSVAASRDSGTSPVEVSDDWSSRLLLDAMFVEHDPAPVFASFPSAGALTGAQLLAEIGDDPARFADGGALTGC